MKRVILVALMLTLPVGVATQAQAQMQRVEVTEDAAGWKLTVDGEPLMVNGMNWDYFPVGTNFNYSLWNQSPEFIKKPLTMKWVCFRTWV